MNPDDYMHKKRDWLADIFKDEEDYPHVWMAPKEGWTASDARFSSGDLLSAGGIVALVVSVTNGMNGRQYSVMRDGELMNVDEVALGEWNAI
jgi:hypothetical protein